MGCGSTALAVTMHVSPARAGRRALAAQPGRAARAVPPRGGDRRGRVRVDDRRARPLHPHDVQHGGRRAVEGGYRVTGDKIFGTESASARTSRRWPALDDAGRGLAGHRSSASPRPVDGMEVKDTWDTMGMRGDAQQRLELRDVFVPEDAVFHSYPVDHFDVGPAADDAGAGPCRRSARSTSGSRAERWRTRATRSRSAAARTTPRCRPRSRRWRSCSRPPARCSGATRDEVISATCSSSSPCRRGWPGPCFQARPCNNAIRIVDLALEVVGGAGYFRRSPLERMYRDVRAGVIMPYNNPEARSLFGRNALGIEIAPEVPAEESGHRTRVGRGR